MKEFEKEVLILDKFHDEYIVHYNAAAFMPNKICMVTEYATIGNLEDVIKHHKKPVHEQVKIKILLDAARIIQYLHNNRILHHDIKPVNILNCDIEQHGNSFIR